jgi:transposase-like protein
MEPLTGGWDIHHKYSHFLDCLEGSSPEEAAKNCTDALELFYWGGVGNPKCPKCGARGRSTIRKLQIPRTAVPSRYKCYRCKKQFNIYYSTIFKRLRIPIFKWFQALLCISERQPPLRTWAKENKIQWRDALAMKIKIRKLGRSLEKNELYKIAEKWYDTMVKMSTSRTTLEDDSHAGNQQVDIPDAWAPPQE